MTSGLTDYKLAMLIGPVLQSLHVSLQWNPGFNRFITFINIIVKYLVVTTHPGTKAALCGSLLAGVLY